MQEKKKKKLNEEWRNHLYRVGHYQYLTIFLFQFLSYVLVKQGMGVVNPFLFLCFFLSYQLEWPKIEAVWYKTRIPFSPIWGRVG